MGQSAPRRPIQFQRSNGNDPLRNGTEKGDRIEGGDKREFRMKQVHRTGSRVGKLSKVGEKKEWGKPKSALIVSFV